MTNDLMATRALWGSSEDLVLAVPDPSHSEGLDLLLNDESVATWLGGRRTREAIQQAVERERQHWQDHGFGPWVVIQTPARVVARGGLRRAEVLGRPEVELFYAVLPSMWRKGIAKAIAAAALDLAFSKRGLDSVIVFTTEANQASQTVIHGLGFSRETVFEHAGLPHILFRLTNAAWAERR